MIIWSGWGIIVFPILIVCIGGTIFIWSDLLGLNENVPFIANLWYLLAFSLAGSLSWLIGKRINQPSKHHVGLHRHTGQDVRVKPRHTFFYIRLEYWGIILPIIGIITYLAFSINA